MRPTRDTISKVIPGSSWVSVSVVLASLRFSTFTLPTHVMIYVHVSVREIREIREREARGWDGMGWDGMGWDGMGWDGMEWDGMGWGGVGWGGVQEGRRNNRWGEIYITSSDSIIVHKLLNP